MRVHHLANAGTVLNVLRDNHTKFVNINSVDLVDGNPKITLALVWTIISRWNKYVYNLTINLIMETYCFATTLLSIVNAKLSLHRLWHLLENRLIKTIHPMPHKLNFRRLANWTF